MINKKYNKRTKKKNMNPRVPKKSAPTNWVTGGAGATTTGGGGGIMDSPSGNVFNHLSYTQVGRLLGTGLRQTHSLHQKMLIFGDAIENIDTHVTSIHMGPHKKT